VTRGFSRSCHRIAELGRPCTSAATKSDAGSVSLTIGSQFRIRIYLYGKFVLSIAKVGRDFLPRSERCVLPSLGALYGLSRSFCGDQPVFRQRTAEIQPCLDVRHFGRFNLRMVCRHDCCSFFRRMRSWKAAKVPPKIIK
jgi:hypothetical protein